MIEYYSGTVFNINADAMVNTINTVGVMGAGLALEFALRYPKMFEDYKNKCAQKLLNVGKVDYYVAEDTIIVNFPTKWSFKYPSKISWIESGLRNFADTYKKYSIKSVAFPKLGTLNGGLDWDSVKSLMEKYLSPLDLHVYICLDEEEKAGGKEAEMLSVLNNVSIEELSKAVRLTTKQKEILSKVCPIDRFWKLQKVKGIGFSVYSNIFNYCYHYNSDKQIQQLNIFDL